MLGGVYGSFPLWLPCGLFPLEPGGDAPASGCGRVVGIRPTGWTWRKPRKKKKKQESGGAAPPPRDRAAAAAAAAAQNDEEEEETEDLCSELVSSWSPLPGVTVAGVPYSVSGKGDILVPFLFSS